MKYVSLHALIPRNLDEEQYTLHRFHTVYTSLFIIWIKMRIHFMVIDYMEYVKENNFLMFVVC